MAETDELWVWKYQAEVTKVIDEVTVKAMVDLGFNEMKELTFTLYGITVPKTLSQSEKGTKSAMARKAHRWLSKRLKGETVTLYSRKQDKLSNGLYFASIEHDDEVINEVMIKEGFAKTIL